MRPARQVCSVMLAVSGLMSVGACAPYWDALTFSADPASGLAGGYTARLISFSPGADNRPIDRTTVEGRSRAICAAAFGTLRPERDLAVDPLTGLVVGAALGLAFDAARDALEARVQDLEERSKSREVVLINVDSFSFAGTPTSSACLYIERIAEVDGQSTPVFQFSTVLERVGDTGLAWRHHYISMSHARAITGRRQPVRVDVAIATSAILDRQGAATVVSLGESAFQARITPSGSSERPGSVFRLATAAAFPRPVTTSTPRPPAVVTVSISETGSGSGVFSNALTSAQDNLKALRDFITTYGTRWAEAGRT